MRGDFLQEPNNLEENNMDPYVPPSRTRPPRHQQQQRYHPPRPKPSSSTTSERILRENSQSHHQGYPRPEQQPPSSYPIPHPNHSSQQQRRAQLDSYNARNHGQFHERNRGSKKAGFLGMLKLVLTCGKAGGNVAGAVV